MEKSILIFMPLIEGGGVEKNLFLVSNFLTEKFKKITLITISKKYKKKFHKSIKFVSLSLDIWGKFGKKFQYFLALILLIKEILNNKNLIVFSFQANIYCIVICKLFGVKVISRSNTAPIGWSKNWFKRNIFRIILNLADKVMVNSIQFKKDLKREFNVEAICIYNPLNIREIKVKSKKRTLSIFKSKHKLKILNVGRFTEQKDQITLLKSLNNLKNNLKYEAVLIGKGVLENDLKKYIKKNNLIDNVKILNFVDNPYNLLKQTDIFVLTSRYEGLPNVLLEALVLNKFIISSDCPTGPKEILLNGKGGLLFKTGDHKQLTNKIVYYSKNRNKCNKLLKVAVNNLDRFDYQKNLVKYYNLVKSFS
jgi:glycosyltransferase involved in cell wall biosynthesis